MIQEDSSSARVNAYPASAIKFRPTWRTLEGLSDIITEKQLLNLP